MHSPAEPVQYYPRFIALEGVDGSGKTTQAALLADWLRDQGFSVVLTREPGGTALAEHLRSLLMNPSVNCAPRAELLLMLASRAQHVAEVIEPALLDGAFVISDRFSLSSLAYQGFGRGLPLDEIRAADTVATGGIAPGMTILVDVPLDVAQERIGSRYDRFEGEGAQFLQRIIEGYRLLATIDETVYGIDGTGTVDEVQARIRQELQHLV